MKSIETNLKTLNIHQFNKNFKKHICIQSSQFKASKLLSMPNSLLIKLNLSSYKGLVEILYQQIQEQHHHSTHVHV